MTDLTLFLNGEDISTKADSHICRCYSTTNNQDSHSEILERERERETETETDRQRDRETDRQTETGRQTDRQADRRSGVGRAVSK